MRFFQQSLAFIVFIVINVHGVAQASDADASTVASSELSVSELSFPEQALDELASQRQWQHLLHIRLHPFSQRVISQNDDGNFFLSPQGKEDPAAELKADYQAFKAINMADNLSAQCQFPARYHWLKTQFPAGHFQDQPCSELDAWLDELQAHSLTLIFPASHINSPSSMYGHTLVRMDREDKNKSKLLSYSVNFAANADPTDNELVFSYKGLAGGYPGVVSVMPYYVKTNEYQHMEYRDVWEYPLTFTPEEVQQFARHVWETKDTYFDYYFFDENCSYRLLALLDAASERSDLADDFLLKAVPVDTIRSLQQRDMVAEAIYRPSAATALEFKGEQSAPEVQKIAKQLVESDDDIQTLLAPLTEQQKARALELSHSYARYLAIKKKQSSPALRKRTLQLLSARSKITVASEFDETPEPPIRDDQGHLTQRMQVSLGESDDEGFSEFSWRIAYHDVMDLPEGFVPGSQIQMGLLDLRYWHDQQALRLQQFKIVDVLSLSHQTLFQNPTAWSVSFGLDRFKQAEAELFTYLKVGFGKSYLTDAGRVYALGETQVLADNQFDQGFQLSAGPRLGWLIQTQALQHNLELHWQPLVTHDNPMRRSLSWQVGTEITDNSQLRFGFERQLFTSQDDSARGVQGVNEGKLSFVWYF